MAESIYKGCRRKGFTTVYRTAAQDTRLSLKARGLFLLMQSLPENWQYTISGLSAVAGTGKDQIRSGLKELMETGYLVMEQSHDAGGKFAGNIFVLQEEAPLPENPTTVEKTASPLSGKPSTEKPSTENPTVNNNNINNNKKTPIVPQEIFALCAAYAGEDGELLEAVLGLLENRAAMRPKPKPVRTARAMNGILRQLDKLSSGDRALKLALLDKATLSNWLTVYPLKPDELSASAAPEPSGEEEHFGWQ